MKKIAFAGSFDVVTKGHLWVVNEGLNIADRVVMMVAHNSKKSPLLTESEKISTIKASLEEMGLAERVDVVVVKKEFTALAALNHGCDYMIRGIRSALDFDDESLIQKANKEVIEGAKTLFVMPPRELESVSSSFVKSLMVAPGWHWVVKKFVTKAVYNFLLTKYVKDQIRKYWAVVNWPEKQEEFVAAICAAYSEKHRAYHTLEHLAHGFQELEWAEENLSNPNQYNFPLVGLAYCVHDVVYGGAEDELNSVEWFKSFFGMAAEKMPAEVANLVMATKYSDMAQYSADQKLIRCIDLCILGQPRAVYSWYTQGVRFEYKSVPDLLFNSGRTTVLKRFLDQNVLFEIDEFDNKYDKVSRANLADEIRILELIDCN